MAFVNALLDKLERAAASNLNTTKPVEEKPWLGPAVAKVAVGILVVIVIVGTIAFPGRMIVAVPVITTAVAAVFGHDAWRKRRIEKKKSLTTERK